ARGSFRHHRDLAVLVAQPPERNDWRARVLRRELNPYAGRRKAKRGHLSMTPLCFGRPDGRDIIAMSARVHVVVAHLDIVAPAQTRVFPLGHRRITAIVESNHDAPCGISATAALADLVANHATGHRTCHGGSLAAIALAHRIAENTAGHGTDDGSERTALAVALDIDLLHLLYHAAGAAARRLIGVRRWLTLVIAVIAVGLRDATGKPEARRHRRCESNLSSQCIHRVISCGLDGLNGHRIPQS